jgi:hypothetical protein
VESSQNRGKSFDLRGLPSKTEPIISPAMAPSINPPSQLLEEYIRNSLYFTQVTIAFIFTLAET